MIGRVLGSDPGIERIVPRAGFTMTLTLAAAAAMAFLAVFVAAVAGGLPCRTAIVGLKERELAGADSMES